MSEPLVKPRIYVGVFLALIFFTLVTTGVAYVDLGRFNTVVALLIAVTKATLVVLFFMHIKYSHGLTKIIVIAGLFWLVLLIAGTMGDYVSRPWDPHPNNWQPSIATPPALGTQDSP
jgi:cytochrome c oxidase subunit 4